MDDISRFVTVDMLRGHQRSWVAQRMKRFMELFPGATPDPVFNLASPLLDEPRPSQSDSN